MCWLHLLYSTAVLGLRFAKFVAWWVVPLAGVDCVWHARVLPAF